MKSRTERELVVILLLIGFLLVAAYRLLNPVPHTIPLIILTTLLTLALGTDIFAFRKINPHEINLTQKKTYSITLPSVLVTTLIAGLATAALLIITGRILTALTAYAGYTPFSTALALDAIGRITAFTTITPDPIILAYTLIGLAMGTGFWLLYPYIPIENEEVAAPATFLVTAAYLLLLAALLSPRIGFPSPYLLVLDAALVAVWGKFFALMHETILRHLP